MSLGERAVDFALWVVALVHPESLPVADSKGHDMHPRNPSGFSR